MESHYFKLRDDFMRQLICKGIVKNKMDDEDLKWCYEIPSYAHPVPAEIMDL